MAYVTCIPGVPCRLLIDVCVVMKKERHEEAHACLEYLHAHRSGEFIEREWSEIQAQVRFEAQTHSKSALRQLFTRRFARRMLIGTLIINMCKLSGSNIIQVCTTKTKSTLTLAMLTSAELPNVDVQ